MNLKRMNGFLCCGLLFLASITAQTPRTDRDIAGLKGKVKQVKQEFAPVVGRSEPITEGDRRTSLIEDYDETGNLTLRTGYDSKGKIIAKTYFKFVDGDRAITNEMFQYQYATSPPPEKSAARSNDTGYDYKLKYKYDAKGNQTEVTWFSNDGSLYLRYVRTFDESGRMTQETQYPSNGARGYIRRFVYDDKEKSTEQIWEIGGQLDTKKTRSTQELDSHGNCVRRVVYQWMKENDKGAFVPVSVIYSTITYYEDKN